MNVKASEADELLCDNNTVETSCQSVRFFLKKLGSLDMIFSKKTILFISNKVYKDLKANKARWTSPITKKALDANELLREIWEWWKDRGPIIEINVKIKRTFKSRIITWYA